MSEPTRSGAKSEQFEQEDLSAKTVLAFFIGLALVTLVVHFALTGLYRYLDASEKKHQPVQSPLAPQGPSDTRVVSDVDVEVFPQPRLEKNERVEINDFRLLEEQKLNSYGWVDQQAGVVRIPIDRAMQLLAERGLPTRPQTGTVPPSAVNMARQAAVRADTSQSPDSRKKAKQ